MTLAGVVSGTETPTARTFPCCLSFAIASFHSSCRLKLGTHVWNWYTSRYSRPSRRSDCSHASMM